MKKSVVFLLAALASFGAFAKTPVNKPQDPVFGVHSKILNGEKVSPLIEAKFQQQYGSSANVSWSVVDDASDVRITIATFTEGGEQKEVYYYEDGEVFGIGRTIRREELPDHVTSSIHARFSSGVIQTAYEFKERDASTRYYARVVTQRYSMIVSANEFGETRVYQKERLKHSFE